MIGHAGSRQNQSLPGEGFGSMIYRVNLKIPVNKNPIFEKLLFNEFCSISLCSIH